MNVKLKYKYLLIIYDYINTFIKTFIIATDKAWANDYFLFTVVDW